MKHEKERRLVNTIELKETIGGLFENQKYRIELKRVALDDHLSFSGMRNSRAELESPFQYGFTVYGKIICEPACRVFWEFRSLNVTTIHCMRC